MFYDSGKNKKEEPRQMTAQEGGMILLVLLAIIISQKMPKIIAWYYAHLFQIYFFGFLFVGTIGWLMWWRIKKLPNVSAYIEKRQELKTVSRQNGGIFAGRTKNGSPVHVPDSVRTGHVQILGSTGRGKTESVIVPWLIRDVASLHDAILIDGKGDPELVDKIEGCLNEMGTKTELRVFDLGSPASCVINPLLNGTAQQITDRLFTAFDFDDTYYKSVQYSYTSIVISLIRKTNGVVTFKRLFELLSSDSALVDLAAQSKDDEIATRVNQLLTETRRERDKNLSGLLSQLSPFAIGEVSNLVNASGDEENYCSISDILLTPEQDREIKNTPYVFLIMLSTLRYQKLSHQLGKLLLQELGWAVGERASIARAKRLEFTPVYLDEFAGFVYRGFENILNKARSSQVSLHLSHQSIGDFEIVSPELATIINTNTNVKCLLGLNDPETADFFARHLGTKTVNKLTERADNRNLFSTLDKTGDVSMRDVEAYKIHPNKLKSFTRGQGVLHMPMPYGMFTDEIQFSRLQSSDLELKRNARFT